MIMLPSPLYYFFKVKKKKGEMKGKRPMENHASSCFSQVLRPGNPNQTDSVLTAKHSANGQALRPAALYF